MHTKLPFAGLRVLELAGVLAGPAVGAFFAELGAQVIKVEPPTGDITRHWRLPGEEGISAYFSCVNWGKQSIVLDLKNPEHQAFAQQMAAQADMVIVNYKPGSAHKLGMAYEQLCAHNPRLIYGSLTGYGNDNPRAGFDGIVQAECGFMYLTREAGGGPQKTPVAIVDLLAAHLLKEALLVALYHRTQTDRGCHVSSSLIAAGTTALANLMGAWLWRGQDPEPMGNDHPSITPYGTLFQTQAGEHLLLAVGTDAQFARLCDILHIAPLSQDPRFATNAQRVVHKEVLKPLLQAAIGTRTLDELMPALHAAAIPAGRIQRVSEAAALPEVAHLLLQHPEAQGLGIRTAAFSSTGWPNAPLAPPPTLGAHTHSVRTQGGFAA